VGTVLFTTPHWDHDRIIGLHVLVDLIITHFKRGVTFPSWHFSSPYFLDIDVK
jgi:hypothetical protein